MFESRFHPVLNIFPMGVEDSRLQTYGWQIFFLGNLFRPLDALSDMSLVMNLSKGAVENSKHQLNWSMEKTHRRVVDPSENGTPNTRSELPMPLESFYRRVEIPIESQVGLFHRIYLWKQKPCRSLFCWDFVLPHLALRISQISDQRISIISGDSLVSFVLWFRQWLKLSSIQLKISS